MTGITPLVFLSLWVSLACALFIPAPVMELRSAETCGDPLNSVPYYRTYSSSVVDHAYTADVPALNGAIVPGGYPVQGVTGLVFITQEVSTVQFYRLYSAAATDHFFTMSTTERDNALRANRTSSPIGTQASSRPLRRGSSPLLPQYLLPATGEGERLRRIEEEPEHEAANTHVHELQRLAVEDPNDRALGLEDVYLSDPNLRERALFPPL